MKESQLPQRRCLILAVVVSGDANSGVGDDPATTMLLLWFGFILTAPH